MKINYKSKNQEYTISTSGKKYIVTMKGRMNCEFITSFILAQTLHERLLAQGYKAITNAYIY